jgi:FMN-dependent oxidoreductase (nitrilotriacetate monooxygenase family)
MQHPKQLHIGLSLAASWQKGADANNADGVPVDEHDLYLWLAQLAEKAKLDFVFRADYLFLHPRMVKHAPSTDGIDPLLLLASIARSTQRIGLVTTVSTTFNPPFVAARQLLSLHWLSRGRAGWNIVTSIEGAENFGGDAMPAPAERYRRAAEFTDVVTQLWHSYSQKAVAEGNGMPAPIDHHGEFFKVKGPLNLAAYPLGTPPLFQAGASDIGRDFASRVADAIFAATPEAEAGIELRANLRARAAAHGRNPDQVRVLPGLYFFLGNTREEAQALYRQAHAHLTLEQRYAAMQSVSGMDVRGLPMTQRITADMLPDASVPVRSVTHAKLLRDYIVAHTPTVEVLLSRPEVVGSAHWVAVGTVEDVVADIVSRYEQAALDGFIAVPGGSLASLHLFFDELIPALVKRGLFRADYEGATLREHLNMPTE